ncbi:hypothetical protein GWQ44_16210 [Pseudomonas sp. 3MA1]|uniref:hypothetical protein n=1 Tax=Pseudomonas sp. 3MA1 TaxID=2699196 RepID=UPI0023DDE658|nr:hypothetical protein [Pseudomonas sp. 3MA1]MDF2397091.1 hypothetical protein [Pseudomonas sp. 3MA1]
MQTLRSFTVADLKAAPEGITASHGEHAFKFTLSTNGLTSYTMEAPDGEVYSDDSLSWLKAVARTWAEAYGEEEATYKRGSEFKVGDMIHVGIGKHRTGRITSFKEHPQFAELNPGWTARVAITDRGSITVIDQQPTLVP